MISKEYRRWVSEQCCARCGSFPPCDPHHIKGVFHLSGTAMKPTDFAIMPLCHKCHLEIHAHPTEQQVQWFLDTLDAALEDGAIVMPVKNHKYKERGI
jgi:hypothetical protein